jgi:hypothetical protein
MFDCSDVYNIMDLGLIVKKKDERLHGTVGQ